MRISLKLSDFINSKYHKETLDFFCGILLSKLREDFLTLLKDDGNDCQSLAQGSSFNYLMSKGKNEIYDFVRSGLGLLGNVIIDFEDFSVQVPDQAKDHIDKNTNEYQCSTTKAYISVKRVWLPRKKPITLRFYEQLICTDRRCIYKLSHLLLPRNRRDVYKFLTWLRLKKKILLPPGKKWCRNFWNSGSDLIILPDDYVGGFPDGVCEIKLNPEIMKEFLDWQHNRYKISE